MYFNLQQTRVLLTNLNIMRDNDTVIPAEAGIQLLF
jgi:hypothetical protein